MADGLPLAAGPKTVSKSAIGGELTGGEVPGNRMTMSGVVVIGHHERFQVQAQGKVSWELLRPSRPCCSRGVPPREHRLRPGG